MRDAVEARRASAPRRGPRSRPTSTLAGNGRAVDRQATSIVALLAGSEAQVERSAALAKPSGSLTCTGAADGGASREPVADRPGRERLEPNAARRLQRPAAAAHR